MPFRRFLAPAGCHRDRRLNPDPVSSVSSCPCRLRRLTALEQIGEIHSKKTANAIDGDIRWRIGSDDLRIESELPLSWENCGNAIAPIFLDGSQDAELVVHHDVVLSRVASHHILERFLFMDVNEHMAINRLEDAGALDFARLEDNIAVGENHRLSPLPKSRQHVERFRVEAVGKGIINQKGGGCHEMRFVGIFHPKALERAEVVAIA